MVSNKTKLYDKVRLV